MRKHVVGVSIGSSIRDHHAVVEWLGHTIEVERRGTNGDIAAAVRMVSELDGKVDAIGMGGIDLELCSPHGKIFPLRAAFPIVQAARTTPIVDGSGVKRTLENNVIGQLEQQGIVFGGKKVLLVSGLDRFGMLKGLHAAGADMMIGDVMFALGIPLPIRRLSTLNKLAGILLPPLSLMPFSMIYPTGDKQHVREPERYRKQYEWADVIAGDFLFINRYMPLDMTGKTVLTNTVTAGDVENMRQRGVELLITTTPDIDGRSFGTNVMQAMLVAIIGKRPEAIRDEEYMDVFARMPCSYRIIRLQEERSPLFTTPARAMAT